MDHETSLRDLHTHYQAMPPVAAMHLSVAGFDGSHLRLHAPLDSHVNDKGCAFGGSMGSMMTLAAWGLVTLRLQQAGLAAEVFVADSQLRFLTPLFADLDTQAALAEDADWDNFTAALRQRGRGRIQIRARVNQPDGGVAAECTARYVAIAKR